MKSKVILFLIATSLIAQVIMAHKNGLPHTITIGLPQYAGMSLVENPMKLPHLLKKNSKVFQYKKSNLWLNYHSVLKGNLLEPSKSIQAQLTKGSLGKNLSLSITTAKDAGKGKGLIGTPAKKPIVLNQRAAKKIIDNIGIANTGNGIYKGHNLTYLIASKKKGQNISGQQLTITFTFFDN